MSQNTNQTLTAHLLQKDDKLDLRIPKTLKRELKREMHRKGFSKLGAYVLSILLDRHRP